MNFIRFFVFGLILYCGLAASVSAAARPLRFQQDSEAIQGLFGTDIDDIRWSGRFLWVATENGLARLDPARRSGLSPGDWVTFTELNGLGRGGISALDAVGDTVWIATVFDTTIAGQGTFQVGTGLSFSLDGGRSWRNIPTEAIFDTSKAEFAAGPTTPISNGCFGLSIDGDTVWAAFFSGSSVRSRDGGRTWERVLPDGAEEIVFSRPAPAADSLQIRADSLGRAGGDAGEIAHLLFAADSLRSQTLLHRTFSVLAHGDSVWIGTASGLTRSFDGGRTWKNIKVRRDAAGNFLPGQFTANWVVGLNRQILPGGASLIWAGTRSTGPTQVESFAFSRDQGKTWTTSGPTFAWNFAFTASRVWAATDQGLFSSPDQGFTWEAVAVEDEATGERLRGTFVGLDTVGELLWVGSETGLARSADEGRTWTVVSAPLKTLSLDTGQLVGEGGLADPDSSETFAAPNPFAPGQDERTRIVYSLSREAEVSIHIYDFASRLVRTLIETQVRAGQQDHSEIWDGRDDSGEKVANGVYFYRIEVDSGPKAFGKVVVLD